MKFGLTYCNGLNIRVCLKIHVNVLTHSVIALGVRAFGG